MSAVLGLSAYYHDAAAALVVDGEIVAAVQEERLSRVKNDPSLPLRAARACLDLAGLSIGDIDKAIYYENPYAKLERVMLSLLRAFPYSWRQFPRALASQLGSKLWVIDHISEALGMPRKNVEFVGHHQSHAASAFFCSPYQEAAVLVVDAVGEETCSSIWRGDGASLIAKESVDYPHSLGLFYAALTSYLGFQVNEGEYKVMGLAAHGSARFEEEFAKLLLADEEGGYQLGLPYFKHHVDLRLGFGPKLEKLLGPRRPAHKEWNLATKEDQRYADIAATLQKVTEDTMIALAKRAHQDTGSKNLCLAGGVALNCVANARILAETPFERVFVQPAAGDAGGALGAALLGAIDLGCDRPKPLASAAIGIDIDVARAHAIADQLGLTTMRVGSPAQAVAESLSDGLLVGVASGRCEWGPRALGQRSILALPDDSDVRSRLNRVVKEREAFRPFAPAVRRERAEEFFEATDNDMTPFMTTVCQVRPEHRETMPAVLHSDNSSRVQTVTETSAPLLNEILLALEAQSGSSVVLNTSLNGGGEPIIGSASDALAFFTRHPIDRLLIGDLMIRRGKA